MNRPSTTGEFAYLPHPLPTSLQLRPMHFDDLDAVMAIEVVACPAPWTRNGYVQELRRKESAHYRVLTLQEGDQERMLGYIGYWLLVDEVHISIVAVDPLYQGYGFGRLLMIAMLLHAYELNAVLATLEVREHNDVAQSMYSALGFTVAGVRKRYYKDSGEDAWIMTVTPLDDRYRAQLHTWWDALLARLSPQALSAIAALPAR